MNKWYDSDSCNTGTVIGGQLCLVRNTAKYPFEEKMDERQQEKLIEEVEDAVSSSDFLRSMNLSCRRIEPSGRETEVLVAHLCIPPLFMRDGGSPAVFITPDESLTIYVNGTEQICIQVSVPGRSISRAAELADMVDRELNKSLVYAFSNKYGYLTASPLFAGTGLSASVLMHLPYIEKKQLTGKYARELGQFGFSLNAQFKGSMPAPGSIYRIRNRKTLGLSEGELISALEHFSLMMESREKDARASYLSENRLIEENWVYRAYGVLRYARYLSQEEALTCLSASRTGDLEHMWNSDRPVSAFGAMVRSCDCEYDPSGYSEDDVGQAVGMQRAADIQSELPEIAMSANF
ncbi:MAG: hypothetical protein K5637_02335 [Lachnospiraceae bacterium]|nr:hypothetical protein [Lachnospiraceae bacterium]